MLRPMFKKLIIISMLFLLAAGANAQEPVSIGAIFDLSGTTSEVGIPYAEGAAAYVDFVNANGGAAGRQIQLVISDGGGTASGAEQSYAALSGRGIALLMSWGTEETAALANRAANDQIPVISAAYSESFNDPYGSAPYNFVIAPTYANQIEILLTYMADQWRAQGGSPADMSVVIFHDDSDFGRDPLRAASDAAGQLRMGGLMAVKMPRGATDYTAELQQADDYGVTHIIIQSIPRTAAVLTRNVASFFGSGAVQIGCLNWCADEQFIAQAGSAANGVLGVQPFAPVSVEADGHDDLRTYATSQRTNFESLSVHFVQGWTAAQIAVEAIERTANAGLALSGSNLRAALESFDDFETGDLLQPLTFSAAEHVGTRASLVYIVSNGVWTPASTVIDLR